LIKRGLPAELKELMEREAREKIDLPPHRRAGDDK